MRNTFLILCAIFGLLSATAADLITLSGIVRDALTDEPIPGVIVKAKSTFTSTDKEGRFTLTPKVNADSVSFRFIGYDILTLSIDTDFSVVKLSPKVTHLNDVIVEAPDIYARGDTLVFNVERYANAKDNAIIDVIKRLPGIKVEDDGTIKYQGKPINKFYLDGNDFIGGQYGLATNNISHKDVKSVEVMENHQPVKALEGIEFPEEAGINLKLKDDARSRWVGVVQAAAGIEPFLFGGSLFTMRMASKMQNLFTLKADNTGWNPKNEIKEHDFDSMFSTDYTPSYWPDYISADIINAPLSEKRNRDNLSWLANAITAWKVGDTSMRLKLNYMADRLDYSSGITTDYFSTQIPTFVQNSKLRTQTHDLSAQFNSEVNKRGYYLKDKLTLSAEWANTSSAISGSSSLDQLVNRKKFTLSNDLKLVKRNEKKLLSLTSRNTLSHTPDRLTITNETIPLRSLSALQSTISTLTTLQPTISSHSALQSLSTTDSRSTTETELGKLTRFLKYYLTAGLDLNYHHLTSTLTIPNLSTGPTSTLPNLPSLSPTNSPLVSESPVTNSNFTPTPSPKNSLNNSVIPNSPIIKTSGISDASLLNNSGLQNAFLSNLYATPQIDYERNRWRLSLSLPLKWLHYSIAGSHDYLTASPRFNARCQLTSKSDLSASVGYSLSAPQAYLNYTTPILSDYRNLFIAKSTHKYSNSLTTSATYRYRNPMKSLFTNISLIYTFHQSPLISNQLFIDDFIISTFADRHNTSGTWTLNAGISKGLGHSKMVVGFDLNATHSRASSMRDNLIIPRNNLLIPHNNIIIPYHQQTLTLKPYFKGNLLRWLSANYELTYSLSTLTLSSPQSIPISTPSSISTSTSSSLPTSTPSSLPTSTSSSLPTSTSSSLPISLPSYQTLSTTQTNTYHTLRQNLFVTLIPSDYIQFTIGAEHYLTHFSGGTTAQSSETTTARSSEATTANLILLDASAIWSLNSKIRLSLSANNLLNKRTYTYTTYGTLSLTSHRFHIRPRALLLALQYRF